MNTVMIAIIIKTVAMMLVIAVDPISIQITVMNVYALNKPKHRTLQWRALENQQSPFYVVNEVTLRGQNPSTKFC